MNIKGLVRNLLGQEGRNSRRKNALILVDVDGTISPCQYPLVDEQSEFFYSEINGYHFFPEELRRELSSLPGQKMWLTAWGAEAEVTFHCGWDALEGDDYSNGDQWKLDLLLNYLEENQNIGRIVWFDDDIHLWSDRLREIENQGVELLIAHIDPEEGIGADHIRYAKNFLERA